MKTQELLTILDNIEKSYSPSSPIYKFKQVFYNIVDRPVEKPMDFPQDLWDRYFIPECSLQPVILNREQIQERKKIQDELNQKLSESKSWILKKIEDLKFKREMVKNKLENAVCKFRERTRKYVIVRDENMISKIQTECIERERLVIREKREEVLNYLHKMRQRLEEFEKRVGEALHVSEKKIAIGRQLDKRFMN